jgi:SAM-dependent methyltransferase
MEMTGRKSALNSGPSAREQPLKLYGELASWWHLLSSPADYAEEADYFRQVLLGAGERSPRTLLELGCGGGNNASHLKHRFDMTLVDLSAAMLEVSRGLNPECEHIHGDMRTLRLGRVFDAVFVHDAVVYMTTRQDLRSAMQTAYVHCRPGGSALFVPDYTREIFVASTKVGGHDGQARGLRYLEWTYDPDDNDNTYETHFAYLLKGNDGAVNVEYDRHVCGLFARADWLHLLQEVGFQPETMRGPYGRELFVGLKPSD